MTELVPPPSTSGKGLLERVEDALLPLINLVFLLLMVVGFYAFFIAMTLMRTRSEILRREASKHWVRELAAGGA